MYLYLLTKWGLVSSSCKASTPPPIVHSMACKTIQQQKRSSGLL